MWCTDGFSVHGGGCKEVVHGCGTKMCGSCDADGVQRLDAGRTEERARMWCKEVMQRTQQGVQCEAVCARR